MGNSKELAKIIEFIATPVRCLFNSENFKIYGCTVDSFKYPNVKINSFNNATIKGDIQELNLDCEYWVKAEETQDKYGISYKIINIKSEKAVVLFLMKFLHISRLQLCCQFIQISLIE